MSISLWSDSQKEGLGKGGVYINMEAVLENNAYVYTYYTNVTKEDIDVIKNATPQESYYHDGGADILWHNCTTYSTLMWNKVVDEQHKFSDTINIGIDIPGSVAQQISNMYVYDGIGTCIPVPFRLPQHNRWSDVFYIQKDKKMIPIQSIILNPSAVSVEVGKSKTVVASLKKSETEISKKLMLVQLIFILIKL